MRVHVLKNGPVQLCEAAMHWEALTISYPQHPYSHRHTHTHKSFARIMAAISRNQSDLMNNSILKRVWPRQRGGEEGVVEEGGIAKTWAFFGKGPAICVCESEKSGRGVCVCGGDGGWGGVCHSRLHPQTGCRLDYWGEESKGGGQSGGREQGKEGGRIR